MGHGWAHTGNVPPLQARAHLVLAGDSRAVVLTRDLIKASTKYWNCENTSIFNLGGTSSTSPRERCLTWGSPMRRTWEMCSGYSPHPARGSPEPETRGWPIAILSRAFFSFSLEEGKWFIKGWKYYYFILKKISFIDTISDIMYTNNGLGYSWKLTFDLVARTRNIVVVILHISADQLAVI